MLTVAYYSSQYLFHGAPCVQKEGKAGCSYTLHTGFYFFSLEERGQCQHINYEVACKTYFETFIHLINIIFYETSVPKQPLCALFWPLAYTTHHQSHLQTCTHHYFFIAILSPYLALRLLFFYQKKHAACPLLAAVLQKIYLLVFVSLLLFAEHCCTVRFMWIEGLQLEGFQIGRDQKGRV